MKQDKTIDITRHIRVLEWLKTELVGSVAALFRAMFRGNDDSLGDYLASIIITTFLLGKRLGLSFTRLEQKIQNQIRSNLDQDHEVEKWYGDLSALLAHMEEKKR